MSQPRYPEVVVHLIGEDGNAFNIMGRVIRAMREAKVPQREIARFMKEAMASDYDNLLQTAIKWVEVR
jgi:hypothetical protein